MKAFVIRLWTPGDEVEATHADRAHELCGIVEQVGSDEPIPFRDDCELLRLLRRGTARAHAGKKKER